MLEIVSEKVLATGILTASKDSLVEASSLDEALCTHCKSFSPALDPVIQQAFLGKCFRWDWPFSFMLPLQGYKACAIFEESGQVYTPPSAAAVAAGPAAAAPKVRRYEFYYSREVKPGEQYPVDINTALGLVKSLQEKGVDIKAIEVKAKQDMFPVYHKAITGPDVAFRSVFGTKGALEPEFGRQAPALLVMEGTDRYPVEVYPRMDAKSSKLIGVEEALHNLLGAAAAVPAYPEEEEEGS